MHTIVQLACLEVEGFQDVYFRLEKKILISGKSMSTLHNYTRCVAHLALHFKSLPTHLTVEQIEDYLFHLKKRGAAESFFKLTVFGMRFLFRAEGLPERAIKLPKLIVKKILPTVLSQAEMRELLRAPILLKHRVMISVLYGCGLRCQELSKLQIQDIDFERNMIHVRQSKGKKDRYVPMGHLLMNDVKNYLLRDKPVKWLFNGKDNRECSRAAIRRAVREALRKTTIRKTISPHTLRHTYATHLLEQGLDIVSIKELLGHAFVETTMVYLHVVMKNNKTVFSPLDTLFKQTDDEVVGDSKNQLVNYEHQYYLNILKKREANRLRASAQPNRQFEFSFK
ncbi:MAG: tyrosine-type recombinase/integrase [Cyclobacteriaceae bacterium]|jgi:site-specific recombinase XerD